MNEFPLESAAGKALLACGRTIESWSVLSRTIEDPACSLSE